MAATIISTGHSAKPHAAEAAREAVRSALRGASEPAFAIVFSTDQYDHDALAGALNAELGIPWAGCCTAGVFTADAILAEGVVVGIVSSRELRFGVGAA
ncbi:MAG: FIST N-terminal domain-containing protein, partial [Anaeromyxobacteraceae bacterium]